VVHYIPSDRQIEPFNRLDLGVPGQLFDFAQTEPLSRPVAQARPPEILEHPRFGQGQRPDLFEVVVEVVQGAASILDRPFTRAGERSHSGASGPETMK
jgi:hypothetical protein